MLVDQLVALSIWTSNLRAAAFLVKTGVPIFLVVISDILALGTIDCLVRSTAMRPLQVVKLM
jgi:hypothetical protein